MTKRVPFQEPYRRTPQRFSPTQMKYVTEPIRITTWSLMRKWMLSHLALLILTPAAQNMICVTMLSRIAMTTTDIKLQICLGMVPGTTTDTTRGFW